MAVALGIDLTGLGGTPGGSANQPQFNNAGAFGGMSGWSWDDANRSLTVTGATVTTSSPLFNLSQTWNAGAVTFDADDLNITDTASASASRVLRRRVGGTEVFSVRKDSRITFGAGYLEPSTLALGGNTFLVSSAANTLALRNSTNAQTFLVNNTHTDASNYERGFVKWESNSFAIGTEKAGTGSARAMILQTDGATRLTISSTGGATFTSNVICAASSAFMWLSRSAIYSPSDGVLRLSNQAASDFTRLQFGGTTSSFPSIKRSTTILQGVLADDSGFCTIQGKLRSDVNAVAEMPVTATHTILVTDAAGTGYKLLCVAA